MERGRTGGWRESGGVGEWRGSASLEELLLRLEVGRSIIISISYNIIYDITYIMQYKNQAVQLEELQLELEVGHGRAESPPERVRVKSV